MKVLSLLQLYITYCKLESTMLRCVEYSERQTAENLSEFLKDAMRQWDMKFKVTNSSRQRYRDQYYRCD